MSWNEADRRAVREGLSEYMAGLMPMALQTEILKLVREWKPAMPDEIELGPDGSLYNDTDVEEMNEAIAAASDQGHATWLMAGGKRIARIVPVDHFEVPDGHPAG